MSRTTIPISRETYSKLLEEKSKFQIKVGKRVTWDEFLNYLIKGD